MEAARVEASGDALRRECLALSDDGGGLGGPDTSLSLSKEVSGGREGRGWRRVIVDGVIVEDVVTEDEDWDRRCCILEAIRCAARPDVGQALRVASSLLLRRSDIVGC